jgi:hypothetical protein
MNPVEEKRKNNFLVQIRKKKMQTCQENKKILIEG